MGFSRQEYWSGLPCPSPGNLPDPLIEPSSLKSHALAGGFFTTSTPWEVTRVSEFKICQGAGRDKGDIRPTVSPSFLFEILLVKFFICSCKQLG